jgi:hypothetical protein
MAVTNSRVPIILLSNNNQSFFYPDKTFFWKTGNEGMFHRLHKGPAVKNGGPERLEFAAISSRALTIAEWMQGIHQPLSLIFG